MEDGVRLPQRPEPLKLASRAEVEQHFRATHKDTIIKSVESHVVSGVACRGLRAGMGRVVQDILAEQRRFPMQIATSLSQAFAHHGLQFFKVNKTVTHVAAARPSYLDLETTPVSDGVKRILEFINAHPKCNRRKLIEALAPSPAPAPIPVVPTEGDAPAAAPAPPEPTVEQTAVNADLHWLIHQGHVIEFANGMLDVAKKPLPKPVKPAAKPAAPKTETAAPAQPGDAPAVETPAVETPAIEAPVVETPVVAEAPMVTPAAEPAPEALPVEATTMVAEPVAEEPKA